MIAHDLRLAADSAARAAARLDAAGYDRQALAAVHGAHANLNALAQLVAGEQR